MKNSRKQTPTTNWEAAVVVLVAVEQEFSLIESMFETLATDRFMEDDDHLVHAAYEVPFGEFLARFLLAKLPHPSQGSDSTAWLATTLAERYNPFALVMIGLCAGNPKKTRLADVIMASSTVRSDFGKLEKRLFRRPRLKHRKNQIFKGSSRIFQVSDMLAFSRKSKLLLDSVLPGGPVPRIHIGLMATGNQVIKVDGSFKYLDNTLLADLSGDEYDRRLVGLDMEAYAVAYVAENSGVPGWLVVKGVCDHADRKKCDEARRESIENAGVVTLEYLSQSLPKAYLRSSGVVQQIKNLEQKSRRDYQQGRMLESGQLAEEAFRLGGRSPLVRRQYIRSLLRQGQYHRARQSLEYFQSRPWYADSETLRLLVEILWRQCRYGQAIELLPTEVVTGDRQLLYLRAINLIFASWSPKMGVDPTKLAEAQELLRSALNIRMSVSPWWIHVNYVFALVLDPGTLHVNEEYTQALDSIREALALAPRNGTIRLYELLLHALVDAQEAFEEACKREHDDLQTALDFVDMVLERLVLRYTRDNPETGRGYRKRIMHWILETRQLGTTVHDNTAARLRVERQSGT